ncbi:hypothetical protein L596_023312 [Steinernema carpocapsae]|uniref:Uncharacterized protein n=1 Tax=Steinernema carpocapsae TaxID=34508 RepID=A0A4U5MD96_STECR|nr:hypothetical protein L596_023312 [Steinernema carpocapsae]
MPSSQLLIYTEHKGKDLSESQINKIILIGSLFPHFREPFYRLAFSKKLRWHIYVSYLFSLPIILRPLTTSLDAAPALFSLKAEAERFVPIRSVNHHMSWLNLISASSAFTCIDACSRQESGFRFDVDIFIEREPRRKPKLIAIKLIEERYVNV